MPCRQLQSVAVVTGAGLAGSGRRAAVTSDNAVNPAEIIFILDPILVTARSTIA